MAMLNAIGFFFKLIAFSAFILIVGNWAKWDGRTLNQHVQAQLSRAQESEFADQAREWTHKITDDAREGINKRKSAARHSSAHPANRKTEDSHESADQAE